MAHVSAKLIILFDQMNRETLIGQRYGSCHASNPSTHHQGGVLDRHLNGLTCFKKGGSGDGHSQ